MKTFTEAGNRMEYVFARVIQDHNALVLKEEASTEGYKSDRLISATQARKLHKEFMERLDAILLGRDPSCSKDYQNDDYSGMESGDSPVDYAVIGAAVYAIRQTVGLYLEKTEPFYKPKEGEELASEDAAKKMIQITYRNEWFDITGIPKKDGNVYEEKIEDSNLDGKIPLSPFADEFANRDIFLSNGTRILYADYKDVIQSVYDEEKGGYRLSASGTDLSEDAKNDVHFYKATIFDNEAKDVANEDGENVNTKYETFHGFSNLNNVSISYQMLDAPAVSDADLAGISKLRPYMTQKEFREAEAWLKNLDDNERMTPEMTDLSVKILEVLQQNGIPYKIKRDGNQGRYKGQLRAEIGNHTSIRLTEQRDECFRIGRVYNDGSSMNLNSSRNKNYMPREIEVEALVLLAIGKIPRRFRYLREGNRYIFDEDDTIGSSTGCTFDDDEKDIHVRTTFWSLEEKKDLLGNTLPPAMKFQMFAGQTNSNVAYENEKGEYDCTQIKEIDSDYADQTHKGVYIQTHNDRSKKHMVFETEADAEFFLQEAVRTARRNFMNEIDIEMLFEQNKAHPVDLEPDYFPPCMSGSTGAYSLQRIYWNVLRGYQQLVTSEELEDDEDDSIINSLVKALFDDDAIAYDIENKEEHLAVSNDYRYPTIIYKGSPETAIRNHLEDTADKWFGRYEPDSHGKRFSPSMVSFYMASYGGKSRHADDLIAAMRKLDFKPDELSGDDRNNGIIKNALLKFDSNTAKPMKELAKNSKYIQAIYYTVINTLKNRCACEVNEDDIEIDDRGVIHYKAQMLFDEDINYKQPVEGEIGQIFPQDEDGVVETNYYGSENRIFSPGYDAYIVDQTSPGQPLTERYRFRGYGDAMMQAVSTEIYNQLFMPEEIINDDVIVDHKPNGSPIIDTSKMPDVLHVGNATDLNYVYASLYRTDYPVFLEPGTVIDEETGKEREETIKEAYIRQKQNTGMPESLIKAIFEEKAGTVCFSKEVMEDASLFLDYADRRFLKQAQLYGYNADAGIYNFTNDNDRNYYSYNGRQNMGITSRNSDGLFSLVVTNSGKGQGNGRAFVQGSGVENSRGVFADKSIPPEEQCAPIEAKLPYRHFMPADRLQMVVKNLESGSGVAGWADPDDKDDNTRGVGVAQISLQGWTYDDGAIISKKFAEENPIQRRDGSYRPLGPGDKICDFSGNKSIIGMVVDPNIDLSKKQNKQKLQNRSMDKVVELFQKNPSLDIIQSPYANLGRFNAASYYYAINDREKIKDKSNKANKKFNDVEEKLKNIKGKSNASKEELEEAKEAFDIAKAEKYRADEALKSTDLVLPDGEIKEGCIGHMPIIITSHTTDEHNRFYDEDAPLYDKGRKISSQLLWALGAENCSAVMSEVFGPCMNELVVFRDYLNCLGYDFDETCHVHKGYKPHNGEERYYFRQPDLSSMLSEDFDMEQAKQKFRDAAGYRGGMLELPFPIEMFNGEISPEVELEDLNGEKYNAYALPMMSYHLRSEYKFDDGTHICNDYTNYYNQIYEAGMDYTYYQLQHENELKINPEGIEAAEYLNKMEEAKQRAQGAYNHIAKDVYATKLDTNHNFVRQQMMGRRMPNSATAVWTPNPAAKLNEIAMSPEIAKQLKLKDDDYVMINRDPVISMNGIRYMKVKIDKNMVSIGINPLLAKVFDGDFDGDSVGLQVFRGNKPSVKAARKELYDHFSVEQNMLDFFHVVGGKDEETKNDHPFLINDSMDVQSYFAMEDELVQNGKFSEVYPDDKVPLHERWLKLQHEFNVVHNDKTLTSVEKQQKNEKLTNELSSCIKTIFDRDVGLECISFKNKREHLSSVKHMYKNGSKGNKKSYDSYKDYLEGNTGIEEIDKTEEATVMKSWFSGVTGRTAQMMVMICRNAPRECAKNRDVTPFQAGLYLTSIVSNSVMKIKKDPDFGRQMQNIITDVLPNVYAGKKLVRMEYKENGEKKVSWEVDPKDNRQATFDEFVDTLVDIYTSDDGLREDNLDRGVFEAFADTFYNEQKGLMDNPISMEWLNEHSSLLDQIAYNQTAGNLEQIEEAARENRGLYDGAGASDFMPYGVRYNVEHEADEPENIIPLISKDCCVDYAAKSGHSIQVEYRNVPQASVTVSDMINGEVKEKRGAFSKSESVQSQNSKEFRQEEVASYSRRGAGEYGDYMIETPDAEQDSDSPNVG